MIWRFRSIGRPMIAALLTVLAAASCASGQRHPSASAVFGNSFAAKVVNLCETALAEKRAQPAFPFPGFNPTKPDLAKLPAIGRYESGGVEVYQSWLAKMRELGQPPIGQSAWSQLLSPLMAHTRIIVEQQEAALRGDARTFTRDYYEGTSAQKAMVKASTAAGVPICATAAAA